MGVQDFFGVVGDVVDHLHDHVGVILADHAGTILCDGGFERGDIGILGILEQSNHLFKHGRIVRQAEADVRGLAVFDADAADLLSDLTRTFPYMGESVLLCSDGLYNNVPVNDIASVLKGEDTVEQKVDELIAIGNKNGGSDNIAVVIWEAQE